MVMHVRRFTTIKQFGNIILPPNKDKKKYCISYIPVHVIVINID